MVFRMVLQAVDPGANCYRHYRLDVEIDLLGDWLVRLNFGRIGSAGRTIVSLAEDQAHARRLARSALRRRATAPRRIGVSYRVIDRLVSPSWEDIEAIVGASLI